MEPATTTTSQPQQTQQSDAAARTQAAQQQQQQAAPESKRQAYAGQWRTPPLPVFGSQQPPQAQQNQQQQFFPGVPQALPDSSEDYAMALQEAYRRGAEAAAAMASGGAAAATTTASTGTISPTPTNAMPTAVSCPNLAGHPEQQQPYPPDQQQPQYSHPEEPDPQVVSSQEAAAAAALFLAEQQQQQQQPPGVPNPLQQPPPQQQQQPSSTMPPPQSYNALAAAHPQHQHTMSTSTTSTASIENRSLSLPDMKSFAARAQAEEAKRKKRLARNRASARLRRLRKKNLVDSYEGEVGVLETSLAKLVAHEWGTNHEALLEALSMERGQQVISAEQRTSLIKEILQQQRSQVQWIRDCQLEQYVLQQAFGCNNDSDNSKQTDDNEAQDLYRELQDLLQLSEQQKADLARATCGLETELNAVETMEDCLQAMQDDEWLVNEGVTNITSQFTNILHANQVSKFLLWADGNQEAMESLDYCHAPSATSPPSASPLFGFGMDLGEAMFQSTTGSGNNIMMGEEEDK